MNVMGELTKEQFAKAIYEALADASHEAYLGIYNGERVTIDGKFNLEQVAERLLAKFSVELRAIEPLGTSARAPEAI